MSELTSFHSILFPYTAASRISLASANPTSQTTDRTEGRSSLLEWHVSMAPRANAEMCENVCKAPTVCRCILIARGEIDAAITAADHNHARRFQRESRPSEGFHLPVASAAFVIVHFDG